MRLKRVTYILGLCAITWISIFYLLIVNKQLLTTDPKQNVDEQLALLEKHISQQFALNSQVISNAHKYLESRKTSDVEITDKLSQSNLVFEEIVIPILVLACNRVSVSRCLDQLIKYRPNAKQFPIIISQDCNHEETTRVINSYGDQVVLIKQPDQSEIDVPPKEKKFKGYFKIARHYGWALNQIFMHLNYETVIIVEDDLDVSPDFFEYFLGTYMLLVKDPTLWCVSAWNDNGKEGLVNENKPELLYRTDFFPGLGWMLTKALWAELAPKWPKAYWDDWIRQPEQRKDRACIRPELSRTRTFGKVGVSNGLFYEKHLKYIKLDEVFVPFTKMNLTYLIQNVYDSQFLKAVYESAVVSYQELKEDKVSYDGSVRIIYQTKDAFRRAAKALGLMDDFRSGVPRTGYRGIVTFHYKGRTVYLAPNMDWKGYDLKW